jgi:hypothetical protein
MLSPGQDSADDRFTEKYLAALVRVPIAPGGRRATAERRRNRAGAGRSCTSATALDEATDAVEQLEASTYTAVSLAEL